MRTARGGRALKPWQGSIKRVHTALRALLDATAQQGQAPADSHLVQCVGSLLRCCPACCQHRGGTPCTALQTTAGPDAAAPHNGAPPLQDDTAMTCATLRSPLGRESSGSSGAAGRASMRTSTAITQGNAATFSRACRGSEGEEEARVTPQSGSHGKSVACCIRCRCTQWGAAMTDSQANQIGCHFACNQHPGRSSCGSTGWQTLRPAPGMDHADSAPPSALYGNLKRWEKS